MENDYIKGPLNYTGGKYTILKDIIPNFPKKIDTFIDMFAGGLNVGINVNAKKIIANDQISYLIEMYKYFQIKNINDILMEIETIINKYSLSQTNIKGYNKLRDDYNNEQTPIKLFVLACFSFNHQIRFNNSMKFNTSFGKNRSSYNESIKRNLIKFCQKLKNGSFELTSTDFREIDISKLNSNDVVYCDPPYLITTGSYNDGKRGFGDWKQKEDDELLELLDRLNEKKFHSFYRMFFIIKD